MKKPCKIYLVGAEKGGVGKSTTAVNIATAFAVDGARILLVGTDKQPSAEQWGKTREAAGYQPPVPFAKARGVGLIDAINEWKNDFEIIVIDAGGGDSTELRDSMLIADILVTPCQPAQFDVSSMFTMDELVGAVLVHNPKLKAYVLVNEAPSTIGATDVAEMREALQSLQNYTFLKTELGLRKAFKLSAKHGMAVSEFLSKKAKAAIELRQLVKEISK